jgi:hypothetical protein
VQVAAGNGDTASRSADEDQPQQIVFNVHGIDASDVPDSVWEHGHGDYPKNGFDHEAHAAATRVLEALQDAGFQWADDISGVSMGVDSSEVERP